MIPNMMADWDGNNDPQSPTIVVSNIKNDQFAYTQTSQFDIRFPFPNSGNTESTSLEAQRSPRDFSFHLSIKVPTIQGSASTSQLPVLSHPSVDVQTQNAQNAQQLEITLKERLQRQRNNLTQSNPTYQRPRRIESLTLPTPPSTSNSERLSSVDGAENSITCGGKVHDANTKPRNPPPEMRQISTKVPEKSLRDKTTVTCNTDSQPNVPSYTKRRYSRSASRNPSRSPAPTKRSAGQKGREYRSRSRSYSPVDSRRGQSYSLASHRGRSVDTEGSRGRRMESKGLQRSLSPGLSSRDSSRSSQYSSRSQGGDAYMRNRARSTSTISHEDQLAVERASSGRYSRPPPPAHIQHPPTPSSSTGPGQKGQGTSRKGTTSSLQLRIGGESMNLRPVASKHTRRRTCPFYHPTDKDRHPLGEPHPGYSVADFEEAVKLYEKGCIFPARLIKQGVTVNPKNRRIHTMRSSVKPKFTPGFQNYVLQSPQARNFQGRGQAARSRSPNESPAKRRKVGTATSYYARGVPNGESRAYGTYPTHPTGKLRNAAPFHREGSSPISYGSKVPNDCYQSTRLTGPGQQQRPSYGRQYPPPPTHMGNHRWH